MKKICCVINGKKYPDRFEELKKQLLSIKEIEFDIYNSIYDDKNTIVWSDFDILFLHKSDIEPVEDIFYKSQSNYQGNTIFFSGGINKVNKISDLAYEINYTILVSNFSEIINDLITNRFIDVEKYKNIRMNENQKTLLKKDFSFHKELSQDQFFEIIEYLKTMQASKIFFLDDSISQNLINSTLKNIFLSNSFDTAKEIVSKNQFEIAIVDFDLKSKNGNGLDIARLLIKENKKIKIVLLTGRDDFDTVFQSFSIGINHFVSKDNFRKEYFERVLDTLEFDNAPLILGKSKAVLRMFELVSFYSKLNDDILIIGENGTGKELVAQSLYFLGKYKGKMISKNCSGIPETLFESEMFGYKEGAFTGALKGGRISPFEESENGILFLDEIGELPLVQQVKLLRVVQDRQVTHLGSNNFTGFNARLVFATNKDLIFEMNKKNFRQDFYYRISGSEIFVPPLRERKEDIELLTAFFAYKFYKRNKDYISSNLHIDVIALNQLIEYQFPGNIRELEKIVNRSLVEMLIKGEKTIKFIIPENEGIADSQKNKAVSPDQIVRLLENGTISSKGISEDAKREVIRFLKEKEYLNKDIAKLLSLNEQSFRNLRSKLKV